MKGLQPIQLISQFAVFLPGNLSVFSGGTVILQITGHY